MNIDNNFKQYHLERYAGMNSRHECPQCGSHHSFTYYIDEDGQILDESVGRCDHESACGYHYTPKQYFQDHPDLVAQIQKIIDRKPQPVIRPKKPICTIPMEYVERSKSRCSQFMEFLSGLFDDSTINHLIDIYSIGAAKNGSIIYWQIDCCGRVRAGKMMQYNPATGHRIKDQAGSVDWIHSRMKKMNLLPDDWELSQCLFGEHLIKYDPDCRKAIALVESEKSAIIGAAIYPQYIWMATGGICNLQADKMKPLAGRTIILFPDVDGFAKWKEKAAQITGCKVIISDILEKNATDADREAHVDIADWMIRAIKAGWQPPQYSGTAESQLNEMEMALAEMIKLNPLLQELIDRLDLQLDGADL